MLYVRPFQANGLGNVFIGFIFTPIVYNLSQFIIIAVVVVVVVVVVG